MGCASSMYAGGKKRKIINEVAVFVPSLRVPVQSDLNKMLRGLVPKDLADRIGSIRNQIALVAEDTDGSAIKEVQEALEEYLPLLLGLTRKEYGLQDLVDFKWKSLEDARQEICLANSWFELLSVLHMMSMLTLTEANLKLIPGDSGPSGRVVPADCMRDSIDLLLIAAGYLDFCVREIHVRVTPDIKSRLPRDLDEGVLEAISNQALAQGTEIQLGLAVESQNATLSVKRRLACELLTYLGQAHYCLTGDNNDYKDRKKHICFIKWKYIEAKAAAYYYHGLILDKGNEPLSHVTALGCFLAAEEILAESKKACLSFCLADPVTRAPPPWGVMKHLNKKIPETVLKKSQIYGYLLNQEKDLQTLPELPEFELSLKPDYELPEIDSAWNSEKWDIPGQALKGYLNDSEDAIELE
ncbi:hypothetical protein LIER_09826 [Lithospermum erythrorhizon]|uniref:BRO1 domain-containing protein n=1 Tax=Lithospermum erythrorhizon TaxID=34254 RepID=A0AAV3PIF4_LITER